MLAVEEEGQMFMFYVPNNVTWRGMSLHLPGFWHLLAYFESPAALSPCQFYTNPP